MKNGAKPTESVGQVFQTAGVLDRWERFKKGEDMEILMKEATESEAQRNTSVKTRRN
jgi:small subunit ribosomal protein S16